MADNNKKNEQPERKTAAEKVDAANERATMEREEAGQPAEIAAAPATAIEASGAIMEPVVKKAVDVDHPAVDNNPRSVTTARQNQIDFNDQTLSDEEAVKENLSKQG